MQISRRVLVIDASDIDTESTFWAGLLGGVVHRDVAWHSVVVDGEWVMGVQHAPNHVSPDWPSGLQQQQMHLDLHVDDLDEAHALATELGGRRLQPPARPADNPDGNEFFAVYASPAGHPFCFGVHQPSAGPAARGVSAWRSRRPQAVGGMSRCHERP